MASTLTYALNQMRKLGTITKPKDYVYTTAR